jgi:hypothetical protein
LSRANLLQVFDQSPDLATHCANCQADLSEFSMTAVALKRFQTNPEVRLVSVVVMQDCCPACRVAEGAYEKDQAPASSRSLF